MQTVGEGVSRGRGPRKLEKRIREALMGSKDPNGITQRLGLLQWSALIARSELANAYVRGGCNSRNAKALPMSGWLQ